MHLDLHKPECFITFVCICPTEILTFPSRKHTANCAHDDDMQVVVVLDKDTHSSFKMSSAASLFKEY